MRSLRREAGGGTEARSPAAVRFLLLALPCVLQPRQLTADSEAHSLAVERKVLERAYEEHAGAESMFLFIRARGCH